MRTIIIWKWTRIKKEDDKRNQKVTGERKIECGFYNYDYNRGRKIHIEEGKKTKKQIRGREEEK